MEKFYILAVGREQKPRHESKRENGDTKIFCGLTLKGLHPLLRIALSVIFCSYIFNLMIYTII